MSSDARRAASAAPGAPAGASQTTGKLVVVSGPSGAGKTTVMTRVRQRLPNVKFSISATTRPPRPGERHGIDYYFLSSEEFARRRAADEFLESCEVYGRGHWYGTLRSEVSPSLSEGKSVILEIDVQGALAVLEQFPGALTVFVRPDSLAELERRLRSRGTESEEAIERRMNVARREWSLADRYQHQVVNDDVERAVREIHEILTQAGV